MNAHARAGYRLCPTLVLDYRDRGRDNGVHLGRAQLFSHHSHFSLDTLT